MKYIFLIFQTRMDLSVFSDYSRQIGRGFMDSYDDTKDTTHQQAINAAHYFIY